MVMNLDRHVNAHKDLFVHLVRGDGDSVEKHKEFYDEYLAVMDLAAEYYLQTIDQVFVKHQLPKGEMFHRGQLIDLTAIRHTALMTIEGEKDDITGLGQCEAALHLCTNLPRSKKLHYTQEGPAITAFSTARATARRSCPASWASCTITMSGATASTG